jgi:UDPglucose--hexose-1-phosphate uridylyltransferase
MAVGRGLQEDSGVSESQRSGGASRARLIWNPLWGEFTAQAPTRMIRKEGTDDCPFCADVTLGRVPAEARVWIRPNDFPALIPPDGECHILMYSRDHNRRYSQLAPDESLDVVQLWQEIYERLSPHYPVVMTWETSGAEIGQTQRHPHAQTYGLSVMPDLLRREMEAVQHAAEQEQPCPFCRSVLEESSGPRVVYDGVAWVGFTPDWARYPYQIQLVSRQHINAVTGFSGDSAEARELATILPRLIRAWDRAFENPMPYMLALHQLADPSFHFHIELLPVGRAPGKLKLPASSEMAWGFWLNDSLPEEKAADLRRFLSEVEQ